MEKKKGTIEVKVDEYDDQHIKTFDITELTKLLVADWDNRNIGEMMRWSQPERDAWTPDDRVYFPIMGVEDPEGLPDSNTGRPKFELFDFKDRLFAIRLIFKVDSKGVPVSTGWEFLYRTEKEAPLVQVEFDPSRIALDYHSGQLHLRNSDEDVFFPGDGIWPWPAIFPEKFLVWSQLASMLRPDDASPLTGLLANKKDPPARTLAEQIARKLDNIKEAWGKEIVQSL